VEGSFVSANLWIVEKDHKFVKRFIHFVYQLTKVVPFPYFSIRLYFFSANRRSPNFRRIYKHLLPTRHTRLYLEKRSLNFLMNIYLREMKCLRFVEFPKSYNFSWISATLMGHGSAIFLWSVGIFITMNVFDGRIRRRSYIGSSKIFIYSLACILCIS
jgi:hypothetical protein